MISITHLLSTCIDACSRGCQVIRFVDNQRKQSQSQSSSSSSCNTSTTSSAVNQEVMNVTYKVANDPRSALTEADVASQRVILYCLRSVWGDELNIIGEEDSNDDDDDDDNTSNNNDDENICTDEQVFQKYNIKLPQEEAIQSNLCPIMTTTTKTNDNKDIMVEISDLTLYIDPMDGTREFVEGRLDNVQCLIGITWKGQPIGGVIGLPFLWNDNGVIDQTFVVSGLYWKEASFVKTVCIQHHNNTAIAPPSTLPTSTIATQSTHNKNYNELLSSLGSNNNDSNHNNILNVYTGDSDRIHKKHALQYLESWIPNNNINNDNNDPSTILNLCIVGGCGNKILRTLATGLDTNDGNALSIITPGTCSWDTAAPTAILLAATQSFGKQGKITDMFGGALVYDSSGENVTNDLGALISIGPIACSYHNKLCERFHGDSSLFTST